MFSQNSPNYSLEHNRGIFLSQMALQSIGIGQTLLQMLSYGDQFWPLLRDGIH